MPGEKKGKCVRCGGGSKRRLNENGVCFYTCLSDNGGGKNGGRDDVRKNNAQRDDIIPQNNGIGNRNQAEKCGECKNTIQANADSMQCESCMSWFHLEPCCNINHVKYRALGDNDLLNVIRWFCKKCDKSIIQFASDMQEIKERLSALESKSNIKEMVKEVVQEHLREEADIEKRRLNVIVYGIPEPSQEIEDAEGELRPTTGPERKKADTEKLVSIGADIEGVRLAAEEVESIFRLGAVRNDRKPRPLCVRLNSGETRRRLLSNAKSLKNSATEWHKKVFVNPDLTPAQRDKDRAARDELKRRKESGEKNLTIRNFKVVTTRDPNGTTHTVAQANRE